MKNLLSVVVLICATVSAASAQSSLRISLSDRSPINVSVDGRYFNKRGQSITVGDLPSGRHRVQIYIVTPTRRGGREEVAYDGYVKTYDGQLTMLTYDPASEGIDVQEQNITQPNMNAAPDYNSQGTQNNNGYNQNNNNYSQPQGQPEQNTGNYSTDDGQPSASPVASPVPEAITTEGKNKLAKLKKKIDAKNTDTEKEAALKDALKREMINCTQIAVIMDWFYFESSKVDFAEWAYDHVTDKESFSIVVDKLAYNTYRTELEDFLKKK